MEPILLRADRAGERADQLLARLVPELTRSAAQRLLEEGAVTLGGRPVKKNDKAAEGDVLVPFSLVRAGVAIVVHTGSVIPLDR